MSEIKILYVTIPLYIAALYYFGKGEYLVSGICAVVLAGFVASIGVPLLLKDTVPPSVVRWWMGFWWFDLKTAKELGSASSGKF